MQVEINMEAAALTELGITIDQLEQAASIALSRLEHPETGEPIYFNGVSVSVFDAEASISDIEHGVSKPSESSTQGWLAEFLEDVQKTPLNVVIVGAIGAGKSSLAQRLKSSGMTALIREYDHASEVSFGEPIHLIALRQPDISSAHLLADLFGNAATIPELLCLPYGWAVIQTAGRSGGVVVDVTKPDSKSVFAELQAEQDIGLGNNMMENQLIKNITPAHFVDSKGRPAIIQNEAGFPRVEKIDGLDSMGNIALALYQNMQSLTNAQRDEVIAWVKQYQ